jgi:hypothetical protein
MTGGRDGPKGERTQLGLDLEKLPKKEREELLKLGRVIVATVTDQLLLKGKVQADGKTDIEILNLVKSELLRLTQNKPVNFAIVIDHTTALLVEARRSARSGEYEKAALWYSTFFEHALNRILLGLGAKSSIGDETTKRMLRESSVRAKSSWLLELLGCAPLSARCQKTISDIAEFRNAFVHYKWPIAASEQVEIDKEKEAGRRLTKTAEWAVRCLRRYEERTVYDGNRSRVQKVLTAAHRRRLNHARQSTR